MSIIYMIDLLMYPQWGDKDIVFNYQQLNILDYEVHIRSAIDLFSLFLQNLFKT